MNDKPSLKTDGAGVEQLVKESLERAWDRRNCTTPVSPDLPDDIKSAVDDVLAGGSAPNRQFLLAIAAGTLSSPKSNPASLQLQSGPGGVDRRGIAYKVRDALTEFRETHGLTLRVSQDAGVSNQWREHEINQTWVDRRRKSDKTWAKAFLVLVVWLSNTNNRLKAAQDLLDYISVCVLTIALSNALDYPKFRATPRIAMKLVESFLASASDRPDAMEAVVTVAARTLSSVLVSAPVTRRRDVNSPDPIDVVITSKRDETVRSGIEVTDAPIQLSKIQHEVVPAMLKLGLDRAVIVSRGVPADSESEIENYLSKVFTHNGQQIDIKTIDVIETWLSFPGTPHDLATKFLWGIGDELDKYSSAENRHAWFEVLSDYVEAVNHATEGNE